MIPLNPWVLTTMMLLDAVFFLLKSKLASISAKAIFLPNANVTVTKDVFMLLHVSKLLEGKKNFKMQIFCSFSYGTKITLPKLFYFA